RPQDTSAPQPRQHNLLPVPAHVQFQAGRLAVDKTFRVATMGFSDERLRAAIERALWRLEGRTGMTFAPGVATDTGGASLLIQTAGAGKAIPAVDEDESYTLDVTDKQARLTAPTVVGAVRGLETLLQLLAGDRAGYYLPAVSIQDKPRFPWRGLL